MNNISIEEFNRIRNYIKDQFGISLNDEKKTLVYSRLRTTLAELGFDDFTQYFDYLTKDKTGEAVTKFVDKITTNHTFFMREADHFDFFRDTVLPYIDKTYKTQKDIRLWCNACSSGEESVTLQIILQEYFKDSGWNTEILATDISTQVLDKAVAGKYNIEGVKTLPKAWQDTYFKKIDDVFYEVSENIRKKILYRKFNLMDNFNFKKNFQVIFCRNVMIYFDHETKVGLIKKFYDIMESGGYLFVGHSESLTNTGTNFKYVKPAIYQKP